MLSAGTAAFGVILLVWSVSDAGRPDQPPPRLRRSAEALRAKAEETLKSVGGLPAHIAGRFEELAACQRSVDGDYFIFDRRSHTVFKVPSSFEGTPREIVGVGVEPGRILHASSFDAAPDRTFVIADAPKGTPRVQVFFETGTRLGGFLLARTAGPIVTLQEIVVSGVGSVEYTGKSVLVSQPESGSLMTEYDLDGRVLRSIGELRRTGQEADRDVHLALNVGRIVANPKGGFYYVFLAGDPLFRKYDAGGKLLFERHIEGTELDEHVRAMPTSWRRRAGSNEIPLVMPAVRAAEADAGGNLWVSLAVPFTYVFDEAGHKRRTVQFRAAGMLSPNSLFFTREGRLLVTPGCYAFDPQLPSP